MLLHSVPVLSCRPHGTPRRVVLCADLPRAMTCRDVPRVVPRVQGLAKPVNDLSRGCTVPDVINTICVTSIQVGWGGAG